MQYTLRKTLPSCYVDGNLLKRMEGLIKTKMNDLEGGVVRDETRRMRHYQVTLSEKGGGTMQVMSVEDLPPEPWPEGTRRIDLWGYVRDTLSDGFTFKVTFSEHLDSSICELSLTSDTAREVVKGIWGEVEEIVLPQKYSGLIKRHSDTVINGLFGLTSSVCLMGMIGTLQGGMLRSSLGVMIIFLGLLVGLPVYCWATMRTPYCIFKTERNKELLDRQKWILRFLATWSLGTLLTGILKLVGVI